MSYATSDFHTATPASARQRLAAAIFFRFTGLALCATSAATTILFFKWAALQVF